MWNKNGSSDISLALSQEQIAQFHEQGILGPFTAFQPEEMTAIRDIICERVLTTPSPHTPYKTQLRHLDSKTVWDLCSAKPIVEKLKSLYGNDLILWYSNIFDKHPWNPDEPGEYPWHQDSWHWNIYPKMSLSIWLALTPATIENGCVDLIPGTHRMEIPEISMTDRQNDSWFGGKAADPAAFDESKKVSMVLKPGEFFLFTERTLHHSNPNRTSERRIGLSFRVTAPLVKLDRPHPYLLLSGSDQLNFNKLTSPPLCDPDEKKGWSALPDASDYTFDQPVYGDGWHLPEKDGDAWFRWTGPQTDAWLELDTRTRKNSVLRLQILHAIKPDLLESLDVRVNDQSIPLEWRSAKRGVELKGRVSGELLKRNKEKVKVSFHVNKVYRPCDINADSQDTREVGLAFTSISLQPENRLRRLLRIGS